MPKKLILLLYILLIVELVEIDGTKLSFYSGKYNGKEILQQIKEIEDLIKAEEEKKIQQIEHKRKKIYQDFLLSRVKSTSVLKDFYSGRY